MITPPPIKRPRFPFDRLLSLDYIKFRWDWRKAQRIWFDNINYVLEGKHLQAMIPVDKVQLTAMGYLKPSIRPKRMHSVSILTIFEDPHTQWTAFLCRDNSQLLLIEYTDLWTFMTQGAELEKLTR